MATASKKSNFSDLILSKDEKGLFLLVFLVGIIIHHSFCLWPVPDTRYSRFLIVSRDLLGTIWAPAPSPFHQAWPLTVLTRAGWVGTQTCSGVILLVPTYICVSVHHSKVKCTWFRTTCYKPSIWETHRDLTVVKATFSWIMMVCVSVLHERGMWKLRVHVLFVLVFLCLILTVIMSLRNLMCR